MEGSGYWSVRPLVVYDIHWIFIVNCKGDIWIILSPYSTNATTNIWFHSYSVKNSSYLRGIDEALGHLGIKTKLPDTLGLCIMFKSFPSCGIGFSVKIFGSDFRKREVLASVSVSGLKRPVSQNWKRLTQRSKVKTMLCTRCKGQLKDHDELWNSKDLFSL